MPISRKFRENMRRVKCSRFVIRIWFGALPTQCDDLLMGFKSRVEGLNPDKTAEDVADLAALFFDPHDQVAALEVLSAATHNGVVDYYEWP